MTGTAYLVGAGPGDPGLLTRRGAELLGRADVVLYDRLVHPELLKLAPNARHINVGKRAGESGAGQARVPPFVRGGGEAEHLVAHGVPFEVVPGVTSAVAAPAYAGIPLTHREHASWVALATGHEDPTKDASSLDWAALARAPVAVFLMGIERLSTIADKLQAEGKPADTPAAVVSSGSTPRQRVVKAPLEKIADAV